jgi:exonuclease III
MKTITTFLTISILLSWSAYGAAVGSKGADSVTVMTWNIWGRLNQAPRYTINGKTARQRTIDIMKESKADIICTIETYGSAADIAKALGYYYFTSADKANLTIFSRYPLSDAGIIKGLSPFSYIGATAELPDGRKIRVYAIWLASKGCITSKLRNKETADRDFVASDVERNKMLKRFLRNPDIIKHMKNRDVPIIVAGDFNSMSHLDYTEETKKSGLNFGRILPLMVSKTMNESGFTDTYRRLHPKITNETLGYTWTTVGLGYHWTREKGFFPVDKNPAPERRGLYCRIDFIYSWGATLKPVLSETITHYPSVTNRSFPEFPSDHAAVMTTFRVDSTK